MNAIRSNDRYPDVATHAAGLSQRNAQVQRDKAAQPKPPPAHADESRWNDPEDTAQTKTPKQVRGFRRGDSIGWMHRRGTDVTADHVEAANRFRIDWDVAQLGYSGPDPLLTGGCHGSSGPVPGPKARDVARMAAQAEVRRVRALIGADGWPLLTWVVLENQDVASWVRADPCGERTKPREMGKLLFMLSRLAEFYGIDSRRDAAKQARKELEQR